MTNEKKICPNCKGNGYHRISWEGDESVMQCETCHSSGEVTKKEFNDYCNRPKIAKISERMPSC